MDPMRELLMRLNITGFDVGSYIDNNKDNTTKLPNIGIAFSGGGYRAMLNGAGALSAWDSRTPGSTGAGQLGGLLQSATYVAGLSGGGWLVGTIYVPRGVFNVSANQSVADQSEYLAVVTKRLELFQAPNLVLNTRYGDTNVPVPDGLGPNSGRAHLAQ